MYRNTPDHETIPVNPLIILNRSLNGAEVKVQKDDACNINIFSKICVKNFRHYFNIADKDTMVPYSENNANEISSQIIIDGILKVGDQTYK